MGANDDYLSYDESQEQIDEVKTTTASVGESDGTQPAAASISSASDACPSSTTTISSPLRWSDALRSPHAAAFTPSRDTKESHHGWALLVTVNRARNMTRCSRRAVALLLDVTRTYDYLAQALLKAGQSLNPLIAATAASGQWGRNNTASSSSSLQESMVFWSGETSRLSSTLRTEIAVPLQHFLTTGGDTVHGIHDKYMQSRHKSCHIRQRALRARAKYVKALGDAEQAVADWKQSSSSSSLSLVVDDSDKNSLPKHVANKLKLVERRTAHYRGLVAWENECVAQCERLEVMALETLQKLEEDRIRHFASSVVKALAAEKLALNEVVVSMTQEAGSVSGSPPDNNESKDGIRMVPIIRRSVSGGAIPFDEGSGIMDAETLGLPLEIGKLREAVRCRVSSRSTRVQAFHMLGRFLEYTITALDKFSAGMKQIVCMEESNSKGLQSVHEDMKDHENSKQLHELMGRLIHTFGVEADVAADCAKNLRKLRTDKLDPLVLYGSKLLKAASDSEELSWKQVCEAARSQLKAQDRYNQTTVDTQKIRDRATSVDGGKTSSPSKVSKQVSKSLANMFSVLPNGGEHAMKMLTRETVASIVQHSLEEADEKESKGRMALDAAAGITAQMVEKYKTNAQKWMAQFEIEDKDGWGDLKPSFSAFTEAIQSSRESILTTLDDLTEEATTKKTSDTCVVVAVNQWVSELQQTIPPSSQTEISDTRHQTGYKITVALESSPTLRYLLPKTEANECDDAVDEEFDAEDDQQEGDAFESSGIFATQNGIFGSNSGSWNEEESPVMIKESKSDSGDENQPSNWLSFPLGSNSMSDSLRGKLTIRKRSPRFYKRFLNVDTETEIFATYFWPGRVDPKTIPVVIKSFACAFREGNDVVGLQYGRVFLSDVRLVFVGWTGKKLSLRLADELVMLETVPDPMSGTDDMLEVSLNKGSHGQLKLVVRGLQDQQKAIELIERTQEEAKTKEAAELAKQQHAAEQTIAVAGVPPDDTLSTMEVVMRKHLRNVSIQRFYEIVWAEGTDTKEKPLLRPWLEQECSNVEVGAWEFGEFTGPWDNECYQQKRLVKFKLEKKILNFKVMASVEQTQHCRIEGQEKCVMAVTSTCEGVPYADTFAVEVRWVARRDGANDISVETGVFVDFKKSTLFKNQIRSGTTEETIDSANRMFLCIKKSCGLVSGEEEEEVEDDNDQAVALTEKATGAHLSLVKTNNKFVVLIVVLVVALVWRILAFRSKTIEVVEVGRSLSVHEVAYLGERIDHLEAEIKVVQQTLDEILSLLKRQQ